VKTALRYAWAAVLAVVAVRVLDRLLSPALPLLVGFASIGIVAVVAYILYGYRRAVSWP